jgi:hypothetical protein
VFNIHFMTTEGGRDLYILSFRQSATYDGLLEGFPNSEGNQQRIDHCVALASREYNDGHPAVLIPPTMRALELPGSHKSWFESLGWRAEELPSVTCIAALESPESTAGSEGMCSSLAVVWFQDGLALPINPAVESLLKRLDWDQYAWNWTP